MIYGIATRNGDALVVHRLRERMRTGRCTLLAAAASGLIADLQELSTWLETDLHLTPFRPPANFDAPATQRDCETELFLRMSEHLRSVAIPQQGEHWRLQLPKIPLATDELKVCQEQQWQQDEFWALERLAHLGSSSAQIITDLELTRAEVRVAFKQLGGQLHLQVNLAEILGAARYKVMVGGRVYPAKCPKTYCYTRDTFGHMLERYNLTDRLERGPNATPFLVYMARATILPPRGRRMPIFANSRS